MVVMSVVLGILSISLAAVVKGAPHHHERLLVNAMIGGTATIQWNSTKNNPVDIAEIFEFTRSNFDKNMFQILDASCNELKEFDGQNIKEVALRNGSVKEFSQVLNSNMSSLYDRVNFTGKYEKGQWWWTIFPVRKTDLDLIFILCLRESVSKLGYVAGYARIIKSNGGYIVHSTKVQPSKVPSTINQQNSSLTTPRPATTIKTPEEPEKKELLDGPKIVAIVFGCILFVVLIIIVVIACIHKCRNMAKSW